MSAFSDTRKTLAFLKFAALGLAVVGSSVPAVAEPSPMRTGVIEEGIGWGSPSLVRLARRYLGATGPQLGLPARLWCADFANMIRRKAGFRDTKSRRAIDQTRFGHRLSRPVPGALLITRRGRAGWHVDVIAEVHPDGSITTIGGNVGGRVSERRLVAAGIIVQPT